MDYSVPTTRDLADVHSLNFALLKTMCGPGGASLRTPLPAACQAVMATLTDLQVQRLAAAPFLLFSLHEQDDAYWQRVLDDNPHRDLFAVNDKTPDERSRIVAAAISFAWQLARRDPYIARLVCGASVAWCRQLAAKPLIEILGRATDHADLLVPRNAENEPFWRRLLGAGLSADFKVRSAAQLAALQIILTGQDHDEQTSLQSAACRAAVPTIST